MVSSVSVVDVFKLTWKHLGCFSKHISGNPFAQQGLHLCPKVSTDTYDHGICTFVNIYIYVFVYMYIYICIPIVSLHSQIIVCNCFRPVFLPPLLPPVPRNKGLQSAAGAMWLMTGCMLMARGGRYFWQALHAGDATGRTAAMTAKVVGCISFSSKVDKKISLDFVCFPKLWHCMRYIHWVVPFPSNSGKWRFSSRSPRLKMSCHPGGDYHWEGGQPNLYSGIISVVTCKSVFSIQAQPNFNFHPFISVSSPTFEEWESWCLFVSSSE